MIKFRHKFNVQIHWYSFTRDNSFLLVLSQENRKSLPPAPLDTSATALVYIFSSIPNCSESNQKISHCAKSLQIRSFFWSIYSTWGQHWFQTGYHPVPSSKKHHVNKRKASLYLCIEQNAKRWQVYFSNARENVRNN